MINLYNNFDNLRFTLITKFKDALLNNKEQDSCGLMGGTLGELLFLLYYYDLTKERYILDYIFSKLDKIITMSNSYNKIGYSFSHGLSGIGWFIDVVKRKGLIDSSSNDVLGSVDEVIFNHSLEDLKFGYYDYISGSLGALVYFLRKESPPIHYIKQYLEVLNQIKQSKGNQFFLYENEKKISCNFGLSHGIPSIIAILLIAYEKKICTSLSHNLISGFVEFLLSNMHTPENKGDTYFSYSTDFPARPTRLAWCYGDLGVGYILYKTSIMLGAGQLEAKALEILSYTAKRSDPIQNWVFDACLCHGSAGIAYLFRKVYDISSDRVFADTSEYWYQKTIELGCNPDGIGGYLFQKKGLKLPIRGFLEGVAGIGISLISAYYEVDTTWDEVLLL